MQIVWIVAGVILTLYLAVLTVVYLLLVISLWCPKDDYYEYEGSIAL